MTKRRVVITGMGMLSPVGNSVESSWQAIQAGRSGIGMIDRFDASAYNTRIGGAIRDLDMEPYLSPKDARKLDAFIHYGLIAAQQAVDDSGLESFDRLDRERVGIAIGSGIGGLEYTEKSVLTMDKSGPRKVSPFFVPASVINMISGNAAIRFGYRGPNIAIVTACTTGTHTIGFAAQQIQLGTADVMVAGGAEAAICEIGIAGFNACKALSTKYGNDPQSASRPYDEDRDGFVMGEGAGVVVLEEYEHAKARGAKIYAEVLGYGMSGDAYHITAPSESGEGGERAMRAALSNAGLKPTDVDYINAHGTSTMADTIELGAVERMLGDHAGNVTMSSTKSSTGHLLGAAGAIEAIFSILAIRDQVAPPTINLDNPAIESRVDLAPNAKRERKIDVALSNSFGFGGTNASVIFGKPK